jgi:hypothetical protein
LALNGFDVQSLHSGKFFVIPRFLPSYGGLLTAVAAAETIILTLNALPLILTMQTPQQYIFLMTALAMDALA